MQMWLLGQELPQLHDLLVHNASFDGHQRVVDSNEVVLAVLFQIHCIKIKFDDVVGVCPQTPLHEGVGGIGMVGEARRLNLSDVIGLCMLRKLKKSWSRINNNKQYCSVAVTHVDYKDNFTRRNHLRLNEEEVNRVSSAEKKTKENLILEAETKNPQPDNE